jgi:transposase InsO family protein
LKQELAMPWKECDRMSLRRELVALAASGALSVTELARRFGVSRKTAHKWIARHAGGGEAGLADRSRRPRKPRGPTSDALKTLVLGVRDEHPAWGGRKIRRRLLDLGHASAPSPATITAILHEAGRIDPRDSEQRHVWQRFERAGPNELWQMDFKGGVRLSDGRACHPLSVIDDPSRYALGLRACADQKWETTRRCVCDLFERYGLPLALLADNGTPWGNTAHAGFYSRFDVWLMRLGVRPIHGRAYHPQTQGKTERFHRTLEGELLCGRALHDLPQAQTLLDPWRHMYNHDRPHEALDLATPASRYTPSPRPMPTTLDPILYGPRDQIRHADATGQFQFQNRRLRVGFAFAHQPLGLRPTEIDGVWDTHFCAFRIGRVDLRDLARGAFAFVGVPASARSAHCGGHADELPLS